MPDLVEQMYCSQQIHIPPTFPFILKQYCKAAIRTQPYDLLRWSAAYFRCMALGEPPPVKTRLEYPQTEFPSGLTPGYLRVLLKQFAGKQFVGAHELFRKWRGVSLDEKTLAEICMLGGFGSEIDLLKFIAIAAAYLSEKLSRTMILICELLTEEPDGGSAMIPCDTFINLYTFLAPMNCGPVLEGENALISEDYDADKQEVTEILDDMVRDASSKKSSAKVSDDGDVRKPTSEELDGEEERMHPTSSDPRLTKCKSDDRAMMNMETAIKNALWDALMEKLPPQAGVEEDEYARLKEELWESILDNVTRNTGDGSEVRKFLSNVIESVPEIQEKISSDADVVPLEILKNAIWETVAEKKPPPSMKGTMWESASLAGEDDTEEIKNDLWNAVVEKIPSSDISENTSETEMSLKYPSTRGESDSVPLWVGHPATPYRVEIKGIGPPIDEMQIDAVVEYMKYWAERQEGMVMPRNIRHFLCPPLDPPEDYNEEIESTKENLEEESEPLDEDSDLPQI